MTDYRRLLPKGLRVGDVIARVVPEIHKERRHEYNDYIHGVDMVIAIRLTDVDEFWTVRFNGHEIEIEDDELIDFPIVTVEGTQTQWESMREDVIELLLLIDAQKDRLKKGRKFDVTFRETLERYDGVIDLTITGKSSSDTLKFRLILNNYEADRGFRKFEVSVPRTVLFDVVEGRVPVDSAAKGLSIRGDVGLAVDLGGAIMKHFRP